MSTAFLRAIPRLAVRDVNRAVEFYESHLGFSAEIHLGQREIDPKSNPIVCRVDLRGINEFYERCRTLDIVHAGDALTMKPWGRLEFSVMDLDGNLLTFAEAPAPAAQS